VSENASQATTHHGDPEEQKAVPVKVSAEAYQVAEDDFDADFFGRKIPKIKLNKGEKRQLKFEMKAGVNLNEIDDLKSYLGNKMKQGKLTHNTPKTSSGYGAQEKKAAQKTNTYKGLEGYVSD